MSRYVPRSPPPSPAARAVFQPRTVRCTRLASGLRILRVEARSTPLLHLSWVARAGSQYDPEGLEGLASLTAPLVKDGNRRLTERLPELAASLVVGFNWDCSFLSLKALGEDLDGAFELLNELTRGSALAPTVVAGWRRKRIAQVVERRFQPAALADDAFARAVYGRCRFGSPQLGSQASLGRTTVDHVRDFHRRHYDPRTGFLLVFGGVAADDLERRLASLPLPDGEPSQPAPPPITPPRSSSARVILVDLPGAVTTELRFGHVGVARSHPDFVPLEVLNAVLGGNSMSRLHLNLRERRGCTYSVKSRFIAREGPAPFVVATAVANHAVATAVREIRREVERLQQDKVPGQELADAQSYLIGAYPQRFQTAHDLAVLLRELALAGRLEDQLAGYPEQIRRVGPEDLMQLARRHLCLEPSVLVAVGPAAEIRDQLQGWGRVTEKSAMRASEPDRRAAGRGMFPGM